MMQSECEDKNILNYYDLLRLYYRPGKKTDRQISYV